jgi:hypothetical protein
MNKTMKDHIDRALLKCKNEIPVIRHKWNNHTLEVWIEDPDHVDVVKTKLFHSCDDHLKGVMLVFKWKHGEKVILF